MSKTSVEIQYPNKKSFDILKKTFDPEYSSVWTGTTTNSSIFLNVYIKEKYKEDLFFLDYFILDASYSKNEYSHQVRVVNYKEPIENNFYKITKQTVKKELLPYINAYKNSKKKFHFFDIGMRSRDHKTKEIGFHAASAIYDANFNQVDFFNTIASDFNIKAFNEQFKTFFRAIYGKEIKLKYSVKCLLLGNIEAENLCGERFYENSKFYIDGPCVIWTLWFLDMRLTNKHLPHQEVLKKALKIFREIPDLVCKVIINYGIFADKIMKKYDLVIDRKNRKAEIVYKKTPQNNRILKMILGSLSIIVFGGLTYKKFLKQYYKLL